MLRMCRTQNITVWSSRAFSSAVTACTSDWSGWEFTRSWLQLRLYCSRFFERNASILCLLRILFPVGTERALIGDTGYSLELQKRFQTIAISLLSKSPQRFTNRLIINSIDSRASSTLGISRTLRELSAAMFTSIMSYICILYCACTCIAFAHVLPMLIIILLMLIYAISSHVCHHRGSALWVAVKAIQKVLYTFGGRAHDTYVTNL